MIYIISICICFLNLDGLGWKGIVTKFVPVGICLFAVMQWRSYRQRSSEQTASKWEITCYCMLPLRTVSRCWGWIAGILNKTYKSKVDYD